MRRERAAARGHALVDEREARQLAQDEKAERAEHVVANDGSIEDLERALSALIERLRAMRRRRVAAPAGRSVAGGRRRARRRRRWSPAATFDEAIQELTLPLRHEDIIRQQSAEKGVDASLIAAVIYSESKFATRPPAREPAG